MSEERRGQRLPPPAFPPGTRDARARGGRDGEEPEDRETAARLAPSPNHRDRGETANLAFIAPDEPFPTRAEDDDGVEEHMYGLEPEGIATGIGDDAHLDPAAWAAEGDPALRDLIDAVSKLAEALKHTGEAGLHAAPSMTRFEATLRAYCVGYLAGRRAEEAGSG